MRNLLRCVAIISVLLAGWAAPPPLALAANLDTTADSVIGQADFIHNDPNAGGLGPSSLQLPSRLVLDSHGNLFVADTHNNRVLEYDAPLTTHAAADRVFGQPDFTHGDANHGGRSADSLYFPYGLALDQAGNLYVADTFNNRVLEYFSPLQSDATADRVFGQPSFTSGDENHGGLNARSLSYPRGVALDSAGNLYVADAVNDRVLLYRAPLTSHAAADVVFGQTDFTHNSANPGGLSASTLNLPEGVAMAVDGSLYVADTLNNRVLEFNAAASSDTVADRVVGQVDMTHDSGGSATADTLFQPMDIALNTRGDLYVADWINQRALEYNAPIHTHAGADRVFGQLGSFTTDTPNNGGLSADSLYGPQGVAVDGLDNLYVADDSNNRVLEYAVPAPHAAPTLDSLGPTTVAAGSPNFELTVTGAGFVANSVVRWNGSDRPTSYVDSGHLLAGIAAGDVLTGGPFAVTVFTPAPGGGQSPFNDVSLYARGQADTTADMEQGQPNFGSQTIDTPSLLPGARLYWPADVVVNPQTERVFVADRNNNRVLSWPNGAALANGQTADLVLGQPNLINMFASPGGPSARNLQDPVGLALDQQGNLYVADTAYNRVLVYLAPFSDGMAASRVFGQGGNFSVGTSNTGGVSANSLSLPLAVAVDALGNVYIADKDNQRVLEYDTPLSGDTTADHVFGQPDFTHNDANHGGLSAKSLSAPGGVATDGPGHLYVADAGNHRVLEYDLPLTGDATADRVLGQPDFTHNPLGAASATHLSSPIGLAVDAAGNLYVTDDGFNRVLEFLAPLGGDKTADVVYGQPDFASSGYNTGGLSRRSLAQPFGVAIDGLNNVYIADTYNVRLLEYDRTLARLFLPLARR